MLKYRFTTVLGIFLKWLFKTGPKGAFSHVKHFVALDNQKIDVTISEEQRENVCKYIQDEITSLAKDLPVHKVLPYNNVGRKNYPNSK